MPNLGLPELLILAFLVLLLFGAARLPRVARGAGEAIANFREALKGHGSGRH